MHCIASVSVLHAMAATRTRRNQITQSNTLCHKFGTDIVPCFHACDNITLSITQNWLLCFQKSIGTPICHHPFAFQGCCNIEQRLHVVSGSQHCCAHLQSWAKACGTESANDTPHHRGITSCANPNLKGYVLARHHALWVPSSQALAALQTQLCSSLGQQLSFCTAVCCGVPSPASTGA